MLKALVPSTLVNQALADFTPSTVPATTANSYHDDLLERRLDREGQTFGGGSLCESVPSMVAGCETAASVGQWLQVVPWVAHKLPEAAPHDHEVI